MQSQKFGTLNAELKDACLYSAFSVRLLRLLLSHVFRSEVYQQLFKIRGLFVVFRFDADEYAARAQRSVVDFRSMLRDARAYERAYKPASRAARARARECSSKRPRDDQTYARQNYV